MDECAGGVGWVEVLLDRPLMGKFLKVRLRFAGAWLLLSEVDFISGSLLPPIPTGMALFTPARVLLA